MVLLPTTSVAELLGIQINLMIFHIGFLFGDSVAASDEPGVPEKILTSSIFNRAYQSKKTGLWLSVSLICKLKLTRFYLVKIYTSFYKFCVCISGCCWVRPRTGKIQECFHYSSSWNCFYTGIFQSVNNNIFVIHIYLKLDCIFLACRRWEQRSNISTYRSSHLSSTYCSSLRRIRSLRRW